MNPSTQLIYDLLVKILMDYFSLKDNGFVKVASTSDIPVSQMKEVQVNGQNICVANIDGKYFAINNICSHEGGPLADGKLEGYEASKCRVKIKEPWNISQDNLRSLILELSIMTQRARFDTLALLHLLPKILSSSVRGLEIVLIKRGSIHYNSQSTGATRKIYTT
jgi:Rieske [2Fe-2S] domain